jgi:hypothetical protein
MRESRGQSSNTRLPRADWKSWSPWQFRQKNDFEEFRRLTIPIKNLAPLIRDEVNSLERLWHHAEERRGKLTDSVELANREFKSVLLAREQLKQMGVYSPADQ